MERKELSWELEADLRHVTDVLSRIKNPWHRYQLTMIIDLYADKLAGEHAVKRKTVKRKRAPSKKRAKRRG